MKCILFSRVYYAIVLLAALAGLPGCSKNNSNNTGPAITGFSADTVWVGKVITINGSGFSGTATANSVRIGNVAVTEIIEASAAALTIKVPAGAVTAKVYIKVNEVELTSPKELMVVNQLVWQKALGGTRQDQAFSVVPVADGGYLVAGSSESTDGDATGLKGSSDMWVVKLNADRSIAWQKMLGGSDYDQATGIVPTADGGCVVAGSTWSNNGDVSGNHGSTDYLVIKLNAAGNIVWKTVLGGAGYDEAKAIVATSTGFVVAGSSASSDGNVTGNHGQADVWIVWLDANGALIKQKSYGGTRTDNGNAIAATPDGGFLVTGLTISTDGDITGGGLGSTDCWVLKLNAGGNIVWQKIIGGSFSDDGRAIVCNPDGSSIVAVTTESSNGDAAGTHGDLECLIVKLSATGSIVWKKVMGGALEDNAMSIAAAANGGCAVACFTSSINGDVTGNHGGYDIWIVRLNAAGDILWKKTAGGTGTDAAFSIAAVTNGFIAAGVSSSKDGEVSGVHGSSYDMWLLKLLD